MLVWQHHLLQACTLLGLTTTFSDSIKNGNVHNIGKFYHNWNCY